MKMQNSVIFENKNLKINIGKIIVIIQENIEVLCIAYGI